MTNLNQKMNTVLTALNERLAERSEPFAGYGSCPAHRKQPVYSRTKRAGQIGGRPPVCPIA